MESNKKVLKKAIIISMGAKRFHFENEHLILFRRFRFDIWLFVIYFPPCDLIWYKYKYTNYHESVGKKTALLQAEASACVLGLVPKAFGMQFCARAIHYIGFFVFCLSVANCPLVCVFLHLAVTTEAMGTGGLRENSLSWNDTVNAGAKPAECTSASQCR